MDFYQYKDKLQLETWHTNNHMSEDMKNFFRDIIDNMNNFQTLQIDYSQINNDVNLLKLYLDGKGIKNDFTKFQIFMANNPFSDINSIRAYFRKQKIEKILNEQF